MRSRRHPVVHSDTCKATEVHATPEKHCPGPEIWIHLDSGAPSRTRTDTVRILSPWKWIHPDYSGLDICLFATLLVHDRPVQSMSERTDL